MQKKVEYFKAFLNEFGEYEIDGTPLLYPSNSIPVECFDNNEGKLFKQVLIPDGDIIYAIYALGEPNDLKDKLLRDAWEKFCV